MSEDWTPDVVEISKVAKRAPVPMSESLRAFRATWPSFETMKIGETFFVPTNNAREDYAITMALKKLSSVYSDRRWVAMIEWRSHIRGRLVACIDPDVTSEWAEMHRMMCRSLQINKGPPPLDPAGNALVPTLPFRATR